MRAAPVQRSKADELLAERYSMPGVGRNTMAANSMTIWVSCIAGVVAGILGLTQLHGFLFYGAVAGLQLAALLYRYSFDVSAHFTDSSVLWKEGIVTGLSSFVLIWTLVYNLVHVY